MPTRIAPHVLAAAGVLVAGCWIKAEPTARAAAEPAAASSPDLQAWKDLRNLLLAGEYSAAAKAADAIAAAGKPAAKAADFLPGMATHAQALILRGFAERQLGDLDAAETSLEAAFKTFRDQDFQRLLRLQIRQGGSAILSKSVPLEITWLELLQLRAGILADRLELVPRSAEPGGEHDAGGTDLEKTTIDDWLAQLAKLKKLAAEAREGLPERLTKGGVSLAGSPYNQAVARGFQFAMLEGQVCLALARLPFPVDRMSTSKSRRPDTEASSSSSAASLTAEDRGSLLAEASTRFEEASRILAASEQAAAPKSGGLKPEQRAEAHRLRAELLRHESAARLEAADFARARAAGDESVRLTESALQLQKNPAGLKHPDLVASLLIVADVAVTRAERAIADNQLAQARPEVAAADRLLARVEQLFADHPDSFPDHHPARRQRSVIADRLQTKLAALEAALPRSDAADAAARRAIRSIRTMAPAGAPF